MRDSRFRGIRKDNGKWVYGSYIHFVSDNPQWLIESHDILPKHSLTEFPVIPETVGEYTGLKDKNGKDLDWWEGDLMQEPGGPVKQIIKEQGCFWLVWPKHPACKQPLYSVVDWAGSIARIGNVHQHPELLK